MDNVLVKGYGSLPHLAGLRWSPGGMCNMYPAEPKTETKGGAGGGHTLSSRADTTS